MTPANPATKLLFLIYTLAFCVQGALAENHAGQKHMKKGKGCKASVKESLVILSSDSLQTQGMAMVLANTMAASGTKMNVLLCDKAGDLALKKHESTLLKPKNVSPNMLLQKLKGQGAQISVCALYLPNSKFSEADLMEGVGVAKPNEISALMTSRRVRVFTF